MHTTTPMRSVRSFWMAVALAAIGLLALLTGMTHASQPAHVSSTPRCLSLVSEPRLSCLPEGWLIDFDLLVTGTLPTMPNVPVVVGSWSPDDILKVLTHTYSAPSALRLVFDMDTRLLSPLSPDRVGQEELFWNHTLGEMFDSGQGYSSIWSSLNIHSYFPCHSSPKPSSQWHSQDLSVGPDILQRQIYDAFDCALGAGDNLVLSPFAFPNALSPQSPGTPRTWLVVRWQPSDIEFLSEAIKVDALKTFMDDITNRYDLRQLPVGDQLIILVLQRSYEANTAVLAENRVRLQQRVKGEYPERTALYFLSVDRSQGDRFLSDEINVVKSRLAQRNVVHLSVLVDRLLTSEQVGSAQITVDYRSSSPECDYLLTVPLPISWFGGSDPKPPFPLDWLRLAVVFFLVGSLAVACSLFLYGRHRWFRDTLRETAWERRWDSHGH